MYNNGFVEFNLLEAALNDDREMINTLVSDMFLSERQDFELAVHKVLGAMKAVPLPRNPL